MDDNDISIHELYDSLKTKIQSDIKLIRTSLCIVQTKITRIFNIIKPSLPYILFTILAVFIVDRQLAHIYRSANGNTLINRIIMNILTALGTPMILILIKDEYDKIKSNSKEDLKNATIQYIPHRYFFKYELPVYFLGVLFFILSLHLIQAVISIIPYKSYFILLMAISMMGIMYICVKWRNVVAQYK